MKTHEDWNRKEEIHTSSDRSFGIVFALIFLAIALRPLLRHGAIHLWALAVAVLALLAVLTRPRLLHPANLLWMRVGLLLNKIFLPLFMGIVFYAIFTPAGFLQRLFGKDRLQLTYNPKADSYWLPRNPPGPPPGTMANQF
jgi:hypothetical protein